MDTIIKCDNLVFDYVKSVQKGDPAAKSTTKAASATAADASDATDAKAAADASGSTVATDAKAAKGTDTFRALDGISFDVKKGEFIAIIGRNGSGKTTLAKCLNALYLPTEGNVTVDGWNTRDEKHLWDIRQSTGMVFQNPDNQLVSSIVEDDVAFGPENLGLPADMIRERVKDALEAVGMADSAKRAPHMLSGGQKQRIAIAGVIAMKPDCIIFDESTAMLDPQGRREIMQIMENLNKEGITVIAITHFMEETVNADRIIVLDKGKIVKEGIPEHIFTDGDVKEWFKADLPCGVALSNKLRKNGIDVPKSIITEDQLADYIADLYQEQNANADADTDDAAQGTTGEI